MSADGEERGPERLGRDRKGDEGFGGYYAAMTLPADVELVAVGRPRGGYRRHLVRLGGETIGEFCPSTTPGTAGQWEGRRTTPRATAHNDLPPVVSLGRFDGAQTAVAAIAAWPDRCAALAGGDPNRGG